MWIISSTSSFWSGIELSNRKEDALMLTVDLNSDLGESYGNYTIGRDDEIIPLISSANVACGFHASDPSVMQKTVEMIRKSGRTGIGAHPAFPDLMGFGRRYMDITMAEVRSI